MTFSRDFLAFLTFTAMTMVLHCEADHCPQPTELIYEWLDEFTVNVSWKKPSGLPDNKDILFLISTRADGKEKRKWRNFTEEFLTDVRLSDHWTHSISTQCSDSHKSTPANITISTPKPRAELVKDFKCLVYSNRMDCSWIPAHQSSNLTLIYRICGPSEDDRKTRKECNVQVYNERSGCTLDNDTTPDNVCIVVQTEAAMRTFKPVLEVTPPKLNITESEEELHLSWTTPDFKSPNCWKYQICYEWCNKEKCLDTTESTMKVSYVKSCRYKFKSRAMTAENCPRIQSQFSEPVTYGIDKPPDVTLYVVAAVIAIILSICFILSCYCFRRHSAIICPIIPDPSAIFKEMMMMKDGNKDMKLPTESLYTPVPEPFEPCKISPLTENSFLQENS